MSDEMTDEMTDRALSERLLWWLQPDTLRSSRPSGALHPHEQIIEEAAIRLAARERKPS